MGRWISVEDKLPKYGETVRLKVDGEERDELYMRDGCDFSNDWFEPESGDEKMSIFITYLNKIEWLKPKSNTNNKSDDTQ